MSDPILRIKFENADGKQIIAPIELRIQAELSSRLATALVLELVLKKFKAQMAAVLQGLGFK